MTTQTPATSTKPSHKSRVPQAWRQYNTAEDFKRIEELMVHNPFFLQQILKQIDAIEAQIDRQEITMSDYESPSWSHKQAHRNGQRQFLEQVRSLFKLTETNVG